MKKIKKIKQKQILVITLVLVFMFGMMIVYFQQHKVSYASLDYAIQRTSNGGKAAAKFDFDKGTFVFIKGSRKKYDYFYLQDKRWYNKGMIRETNFNIEKKYEVTVYYVPENKLSFIKVESEKELSNIGDSINTEFKLLSTSKNKSFFFGGTYKELPDEYMIYINDKEYLLKEYNGLFKMYS